MIIVDILMVGVFIFAVSIPFLLLWAIFSDDQYVPMSPDQEIEWLLKVSGMTRAEAEEMVNQGYPGSR